MPTAFLFPGQGSQFVGMARDLHQRYPEVQALFDEAEAVLGFDIGAVMFGTNAEDPDPAATLRMTANTQPALYLHSMAAWTILRQHGARPDCTAGHSLGEYTALAAAGAITFEDGLRVVRTRGELMADANRVKRGTMMAVIGLDDEVVSAICARVERESGGIVRPANYNSPGQVVISGETKAIEDAGRLAADAGARKVVPLEVGGAFHSPLMAHAAEGLSEALHVLKIRKPACPIFLNVTAEPVTDAEVVRAMLLEQLVSPVLWTQSVLAMREAGMTRFVEVGAGKVLSGLVKRILDRDVTTAQAGTVEQLEELEFQDG